MVIPTIEPLSVRAGESWRWKIACWLYPAPAWTLSYVLASAAARITLTATADGADHSIYVAPATSAAYTSGRYYWISRAGNGADIYPVGAGSIVILPSLSVATDTRSHARRMLDSINALLEGRATAGDLDLVRASHGEANISSERDLEQLIKLRSFYAAEVAAEDRIEKAARGEKTGFVQMRFT